MTNKIMGGKKKVTSHSTSVVFPTLTTQFPSILKENTVIVLKSRDSAFSFFVDSIKHQKMVGMDAQFANNTARFAVYVVVVQNSDFVTIPGFIFLIAKNTTQNLCVALGSCIKYLKEQFKINWDSRFCIDKDNVEQSALSSFGFGYFLCEVHVFRTISRMVAKFDDKGEILLRIKVIARAKDENSLQIGIKDLEEYCNDSSHEDFFQKFKKNWLCERWLLSWTDMERGSRDGLENTNNACESFFKILLRSYLSGYSAHPVEVLRIIEESLFCQLEVRLKQQKLGWSRYNLNSSVSQLKEVQNEAKKLAKSAIYAKKDNHFIISSNNKLYQCNDAEPTFCSCFYWRWTGKLCKHIKSLSICFEFKDTNQKVEIKEKIPVF